MLLALRDYIAKEQCVSTELLARFFKIEATALEPMLKILIDRGVIGQEQSVKTCAAACQGCQPKNINQYYYLMLKNK